jgi:hypothetical protein
VLISARTAELPILCLDGTLVPTDRVTARAERGYLWYSGKHHALGGRMQVLTDPSGFPLWTSPVRPGSTHDLTAARELVLPTRAVPARPQGLPVLADKGYTGVAIGVHVPVKHQPDGPLHVDNCCYCRVRQPSPW